MATLSITKVNGVNIVVSNDTEKLVPIKPICEALGVDTEGQRQRIQKDEILSSVACMTKATAADGKQYEMAALPLEFIFGWLFSIDHSRVSESARPLVVKYKRECYHALFEYFTEPQTFLKQKQIAMEAKIGEYQEKQRRFKDAQKEMADAKAKLNDVMKITIEDWRANNRQLTLDLEIAQD